VKFLQWALPRLGMRWPGFRKVRNRVCKPIARRIASLNLSRVGHYQDYLESHPEEWQKLDELCRVTVSRFYRDKMVFRFLEQQVLPTLASGALAAGEETLEVWSVGCASGEEPYSLAILWQLALQSRFPNLAMNITASDINPELLARAGRACYPFSSVKNLPPDWRRQAFRNENEDYCLRVNYTRMVNFHCHDVRESVPEGAYHLILCRNLVFTYYEQALQQAVAERTLGCLKPGGVLVIGIHELLPDIGHSLEAWSERLGIYRLGR